MATEDKSHVDGSSRCFSESEVRSWPSQFDSKSGKSCDEIGGVSDPRKNSSSSDCSVEVDLESGVSEIKVHLAKVEKDCRICHLTLESDNKESGIPIELGCSCKDDLAAAHKQCAEVWFKIRGNKTCEICGAVARNVIGPNETELIEQWNEMSNATTEVAPSPPADTRSFWHGHRFLNFLLACMVFAFVISWLFHFNVPS